MKLSAKTEYGIQALLELAGQTGAEPVQARAIARNQRIPGRFLEQVLGDLRKAGLIDSVRGAQGGYTLSRPASEIRLTEVIEALEGPLGEAVCSAAAPGRACWHQLALGDCPVGHLKSRMRAAIGEVLNATTLQELVERRANRVPMFHI